ncbi:MAG: GTPase [Ruminococcus sp.]|uniref:TIGR03943 family putative permease subunit n=1 Tax=Ruminococcus sp. TaxID=41978 RepID=UPI0025E8022A|nr:GTP-binding protein [Ruminococcus sp.]MBO4864980.1 GTPase [Ruminococcus sp.]
MSKKNLPVYLFLGPLESGKTTFTSKIVSNDRFGLGKNVLILVCEEGETEYDLSKFTGKNVTVHVIEEDTELDAKTLDELAESNNADIIVIEYNGMWHMNALLANMPENWGVYESVFLADASVFEMYFQNFKSIIIDKLNVSDTVIFNRYENNADTNDLHRIVRTVNRRCKIFYCDDSGVMNPDETEDPLPFDINAETIIIKDEDYAIWYNDIMNEAAKYQGKSVRFKALITARQELPKNVFAIGRYIMTCCEADMEFCWLLSMCNRYYPLEGEKWVSVTADVMVQNYEKQNLDVPALKITDLYECDPPKEPIATF